MFEYDRNKDEIKESAVDWKKQHGMPKNVFAMSTCISKRVKWLMDTGCGHDLIGRARQRAWALKSRKMTTRLCSRPRMVPLPHLMWQDSRGRVGRDCRAACIG